MIPLEQEAHVQQVLRLRLTDWATLRQQTRGWTLAHFDYAESRIQIDVGNQHLIRTIEPMLLKLREEYVEAANAKEASEAEERRHREALTSNIEALRTSRLALWISVVAAIAAVLSWLVPRIPS